MRASGILLPVFSLPSSGGIGSLGQAAYDFAEFLARSGQKYWQVLPVSPTSYGDSPYQSFSSFAGNPYFIDLDLLAGEGLLDPAEYQALDWGGDPARVDYARLYELRFPVLEMAFARFRARGGSRDYDDFKEKQAPWLEDYALYMALKAEHGGRSWAEWPEALRRRAGRSMGAARRRLADRLEFWRFVQYEFFTQWAKFKAFVNARGIRLIGDIPIYVAPDSADVWANPALFALDEALAPIEVAGCPPDYFSATGQLWGNPVYNWEANRASGYDWWIRRIAAAVSTYDIVRIDHFRGFESFYAIPAGDKTAEHGVWRKGPGIALFHQAQERLGALPILAEDLGVITDEVRELLWATGYPGMKVLQFAFDPGNESAYLPHNMEKNCVCYTGTHDNDTLTGWAASLGEAELDYALRYARAASRGELPWGILALAWGSPADIAIAQMQDFLGLGAEARMNTPSTSGGNWQWRLQSGQLTDALADRLRALTRLYWR